MGLGLARTVRRQQAQTLAFIDAVLRTALMSLFDTLGKYDLDGNLQALDLALGRLREEARQLQGSAAARCKTYVTLGVCTGLAVAVILI